MNMLLDPEIAQGDTTTEAVKSATIKPNPRILLLTPYSGGNLGDGVIQDAVIHQLRKRIPEIQIGLVTLDPRNTSRLHGVRSFPIASSANDDEATAPTTSRMSELHAQDRGAGSKSRIKRVLRQMPWLHKLARVPGRAIASASAARQELRHCRQAYRLLKATDVLVISGGGQIDDFWGGAFGHPYALWKWTGLARAAKTRVVFLSVGVCALDSWLSRRFAGWALRQAEYRSYRDPGSKELLCKTTFTHADPVYPDLAFSHPCARNADAPHFITSAEHLVIGLSPMVYLSPNAWPQSDPVVYKTYIETLSEFAVKVLTAGHSVVLFTSAAMDQSAVNDLAEKLEQHLEKASWGDRWRRIEQTSVDRQLNEIRQFDLVVATRLHGIILSHLVGKPVLAIAYDRKVRAHMEIMNQERFCFNLRDCQVPQLWNALEELTLAAAHISSVVRKKTEEFSQDLDAQYDRLNQICLATKPH